MWSDSAALKKRVLHLEEEFGQYRHQMSERLLRHQKEIEKLRDELERARRLENTTTTISRAERERGKEVAPRVPNKRMAPSSLANKKVKMQPTSTSARVVPLQQVPAPPAPPPKLVIVEAASQPGAPVDIKRNQNKRRLEEKDPPTPRASNFPFSLSDVMKTRNALRPPVLRQTPMKQFYQDDLKAALIKKFENVNAYSPIPTTTDSNDSFCEAPSPYRGL